MAIVQTTVNIDPVIFGFSGLGGMIQPQTEVPRGEVVYSTTNEAVTVGTGDGQFLEIICNLPRNFAYVLMEIHLGITGVGVDDWDEVALAALVDTKTPNGRSFNLQMQGTSNGLGHRLPGSNFSFRRLYTFEDYAKVLVQGSAARLNVDLANDGLGDLDQVAAFEFYARFLMYDIDQAHHYQVNTPTPVR